MNDDTRLDCSDMDEATDSGLRAQIRKLTQERDTIHAELVTCQQALASALYCIEMQNMHSYDEQPDVETAIANGYWCKMAMDARAAIIKAIQPSRGEQP